MLKWVKTAKFIAITAIMTATLSLGKFIFSWLAGFELVTTLLFVYSAVFGLLPTLLATIAFIGIDMAIYGAQIWVVMYLIHFPFVVLVGYLAAKFKANDFIVAIFAALATVAFSFQTTLIEHLSYGMNFWARFATGIPTFVINTASNFVLVLVAYKPLRKVLKPFALNFNKSELITKENETKQQDESEKETKQVK